MPDVVSMWRSPGDGCAFPCGGYLAPDAVSAGRPSDAGCGFCAVVAWCLGVCLSLMGARCLVCGGRLAGGESPGGGCLELSGSRFGERRRHVRRGAGGWGCGGVGR